VCVCVCVCVCLLVVFAKVLLTGNGKKKKAPFIDHLSLAFYGLLNLIPFFVSTHGDVFHQPIVKNLTLMSVFPNFFWGS